MINYMQKIKYDNNAMKFMALFESITGSKLKDCFLANNIIYFIVHNGQIGLALGRKGSNIKRLEQLFNRKIKIVEFSSKPEQFINNLIFPIKADEISMADGIVTISAKDSRNKGLLIGRAAQNLRNHEMLAKRYFDIKEIKVV